MFERLGARKYAVPIGIIILMSCLMALMFYPMAHMEMKNLPFAVLSLDEGMETAQGTVNVGDTLVDNITSATSGDDGASSAIAWTRVGSQEELDEALDNGEFYGAIVVPENFTADQMAAQQAKMQETLAQAQQLQAAQAAAAAAAAQGGADPSALAAAAQNGGTDAAAAAAAAQGASGAAASSGAASALAAGGTDASAALSGLASGASDDSSDDAPSLQVILDKAKSPMIAAQMGTQISSMFSSLGVNVDVQTIHEGETTNASTGNAMSTMMSLQIGIMPLVMMSLACGIVLSRIAGRKQAAGAERWAAVGKQVACAVVASLLVGVAVYLLITGVAQVAADAGSLILFAWLASFCLMLFFLGVFNLSMPLGVVCALCVFGLGMSMAMLPYEALPTFWQDWVYPWAPQRHIGDGMLEILYRGAGAWNSGSGALVITGVIGAVLAAIAALIPRRGAKDAAAA